MQRSAGQTEQRSETLRRRGHDGWALMVLHLRTRAIPSPRHPDPVLVSFRRPSCRAADRLPVPPDPEAGLPSQNGIGLGVGKHFLPRQTLTLSYLYNTYLMPHMS
jgi:hypothetical protein